MTTAIPAQGLFEDLRLNDEDSATFDRLHKRWRSAEARLQVKDRGPAFAGIATMAWMLLSVKDGATQTALIGTLGVLAMLPSGKLSKYRRDYLLEQAKKAKREFQDFSRQISHR